jgi:hypothetical protein
MGRRGGAGTKLLDVVGRAAFPGTRSGKGRAAEVAADIGDDLGHGPVADLVVEVGTVQPVEEFGVQALRLRSTGTVSLPSRPPLISHCVMRPLLR